MTTSTERATRLESLTGLRFLAAFWVFGFHALVFGAPRDVSAFTAGMAGVSFFFVVSGYVLAWSLRPGTSAWTFHRRRFARIYPAYVVAWLLALAVLVVQDKDVPATDLVAPTLVQAWAPAREVYFSGASVFWSLSAEAFFYLTFPVLAPLLDRLGTRRLAQAAAAFAAMPLVLAMLIGDLADDAVAHWLLAVFPPLRLPEFLLGVCLALLARRGVRPPVRLGGAAPLALIAVVVAGFVPEVYARVAVTIVPFALLVCAAAAADVDDRTSWLRARPLVVLGTWSYCFYLVHTQTLDLWFEGYRRLGIDHETLTGPPLVMSLLGALLTATAAAWALHAFVERPAELRLRPATSRASAERRVG